MTNLYFLKIFFIERIIPYTFMTLSIAYLLMEITAPKEFRVTFYDFSDRLFFKFIYRPLNKLFILLKKALILNLNKMQDFLAFNEKLKLKTSKKIKEKKAIQTQKREEKKLIKMEKKKDKLLIKTQKREENLQVKLENKRLKAELKYKLKLLFAYKFKKILTKFQQK